MYWQLLAVGIIVALAATYLAHRVWRTWRQRGCASGCGCATRANGTATASTTLIPAEQLKMRDVSR